MNMKKNGTKLLAAVLCLMLLLSGCAQNSGVGGLGTTQPADSAQGTGEEAADDAKIHILGSYEEGALVVSDYFGYETKLSALPERVAIVSGTPLNIWYDLGGKSVCTSQIADGNLKLVEECREEMLALPVVGAVYSLDMEAVVAQEPDLIITQAGVQTTQTETLRNMGYAVIAVLPRSFDDVVDLYDAFGAILGQEQKAQDKIETLSSARQALIDKAPAEGKSVVILYLTASALSVKLDGSIAGDIANSLGIRNIASDLPPDTIGSENTPLDIEYIVAQNPDMVLVTSMIGSNELAVETMERHFADNQAWQTVEAVAAGRVYYLPQEYFLYNAGPYYDEAVHYMACTVYPEIYGEVSVWYAE